MNKTQVFLLIAVLSLGTFFVWSKNKRFEEEENKYQQARYFPKLEEKDVETIKVVCSDPQFEYELKRVEDAWFINSHLLNVDKTYQLVSSILELSTERVMEEKPDAAREAEFQLDKPLYYLTLFGNGGKDLGTIKLGKRTPDFNHFYGQRADGGAISTVPAYTLGTLEEKPEDLTERALFPTEVESVERFSFGDANEEKAVLVREGETKFKFEKPDLGEADEAKVTEFLQQLKDLKLGRFLASGEDTETGDVQTRFVARVGHSDFEQVTELRGRVSVKPKFCYGDRYLRHKETKKTVEGTLERFVIELSADGDVANPTVSYFEDRRILVFDMDEVKGLKLIQVERETEMFKDGLGKWKQKTKDGTKEEEAQEANDFLWFLKDLYFSETSDSDVELKTEEISLQLSFKSGPNKDVRFGLAENGNPFLRRDSKSYALSQKSWDKLQEALAKLRI